MQLKIISFVPVEYHALVREVLRGVPARAQDQETILGLLVEQNELACVRFLVERWGWRLQRDFTLISIHYGADKEMIRYCYERDYTIVPGVLENAVALADHKEAMEALRGHPWDHSLFLAAAMQHDRLWIFEWVKARAGWHDVEFFERVWKCGMIPIPATIARWMLMRNCKPPRHVQKKWFCTALRDVVHVPVCMIPLMGEQWTEATLDQIDCDSIHRDDKLRPRLRWVNPDWCTCDNVDGRHSIQ